MKAFRPSPPEGLGAGPSFDPAPPGHSAARLADSFFRALRRLRHGPLKGLGPLWTAAGRLYRWGVRDLEGLPGVAMRIGPYGPFRLHPHFAFSDFEGWGKGHNAGFVPCIEACRGATTVIDVGAHVGLVALPAASVVAEGGRVYAFEPSAANRRFLEDHVRRNGATNVEVSGLLVGDRDREDVAFYERREDSGMNAVVVSKDRDAYLTTHKRQVALDTFCATRNLRPKVIKIDVEGYEIEVLAGARRVIREAKPRIFLSVHPEALALLGHGTGELRALVLELGYEIRNPLGGTVDGLAFAEYLLLPREAA